MKFADLIKFRRDGTPRPVSEQRMIPVAEGTCSHCGSVALCAYYIMLDKYFCSDECRDMVSPS